MLDELQMAKWAKVRRRGMLRYVIVRAIAWGLWMTAVFYFIFWSYNPSWIFWGLVNFLGGCLLFYWHWQHMEAAYFERQMFDANRPTNQSPQ
jgi:hypothetical protein